MLLVIDVRNPGEASHFLNDDSFFPSSILIINYREWEYTSIGSNPSFNTVVKYSNIKNIPIYIINGSADDTPHLYNVTDEFYKNIQPIISFPIYFLIQWKKLYLEFYKEFPPVNVSDYRHLFINLNFRVHYHRCCQIDMLAKNDLIKYGAISWHGVRNQEQDLTYTANYKFKYWLPSQLILDNKEDKFYRGFGTNIPNQYQYSFVHLVSESTSKVKFITEKTVLPLFYGKIFLISGAPGINKYLKKLGFEIFDEIFDYSFDDVEDDETRFDMIAKNISSLKNMTQHDLEGLYQKVRSKLLHNQNRLVTLEQDLSLWPDFLVDLCQNSPEFSRTEITFWYQDIIKNVS